MKEGCCLSLQDVLIMQTPQPTQLSEYQTKKKKKQPKHLAGSVDSNSVWLRTMQSKH
jgi:hypothetical protein